MCVCVCVRACVRARACVCAVQAVVNLLLYIFHVNEHTDKETQIQWNPLFIYLFLEHFYLIRGVVFNVGFHCVCLMMKKK